MCPYKKVIFPSNLSLSRHRLLWATQKKIRVSYKKALISANVWEKETQKSVHRSSGHWKMTQWYGMKKRIWHGRKQQNHNKRWLNFDIVFMSLTFYIYFHEWQKYETHHEFFLHFLVKMTFWELCISKCAYVQVWNHPFMSLDTRNKKKLKLGKLEWDELYLINVLTSWHMLMFWDFFDMLLPQLAWCFWWSLW